MKNYHNQNYLYDVKTLKLCGKFIAFEGKVSKLQLPFMIEQTFGNHDLKNCHWCSKNLQRLSEQFQAKHDGDSKLLAFPFCCAKHAMLTTEVEGFKREWFDKVPDMTAKKIMYVYNHIINHQGSKNWEKEISDYMEYAVKSFGTMPLNCGNPLFLSDFFAVIKNLLELHQELKVEVKDLVIKKIDTYYIKNQTSDSDFNELMETYQKWLDLFPFDLSFFKPLKSRFDSQLPFMETATYTNKYTGETSSKLITKEFLFSALIKTTSKLLTQLNTATLFEKGELTEPEKIKLELVIQSRKLSLKRGYFSDLSDQELEFNQALEKWFKDEKDFLNEITPLLQNATEQTVKSKQDKLEAHIRAYGFFELPKIKLLSKEADLIELLKSKESPYIIAFFDHVGFLDHLIKEHFSSNKKRNQQIAIWLGTDKDGRSVRANISTLNPKTKEDPKRYTAHLYKEEVRKDYQKLK